MYPYIHNYSVEYEFPAPSVAQKLLALEIKTLL